jgi:hypothetical protein
MSYELSDRAGEFEGFAGAAAVAVGVGWVIGFCDVM